jgi:hypothetical protein
MSRFYVHDEQSEIPVAPGGVALPGGSAFMFPGIYIVNGISYDCTRPGLYRWWVTAGYFVNRIVWKAPSAPTDVAATLSAVSWNHVHGTGTEYGLDGAALQSMSNAGRTVKWSARCGYIAAMCAWLMPQVGVTARICNVSTTGVKNGYDDGHIVVETLHGTEWRMWDITNGCYFLGGAGNHLNAAELVAWLAVNPDGMPERVRLDYDHKYNHDYAGSLDLGLYWQWMLDSPAQSDAWYRRIFQSIV